ncbi:hypothetical protein NC797_07690 [Aquibacillus sp. 3ASR75-11]|uniref:Uncharacterized protein n=1 Tax=Terrihalobacillus insolitus TaxID=2950438 RepID=A0A9X4ANC8_9BACI|nr:hypothetical protein [Terrihalobacillus insolitus]MDC3424388.1 hypothetical protein [Terrihalobacillus insolitus]
MTVAKLLVFPVIILFFIILTPLQALAAGDSPLPFLPQKDGTEGKSKDVGIFAEEITNYLNGQAPEISFTVTAVFAIMFLIGVIKMGYALVTKTGAVLKGSTGILIGIPILVMSIRLFFILFFTTSGPGVTLLVSVFMLLLTKAGFFAAIGMVLVGLVMRLFHKFLNHPEYARWSKRLNIGAVCLSILTAVMPMVIQGI